MAFDDFIKGRKNPDTSKKTRRAQMKEAREKLKRAEAQERQAAWEALSILEKIATLDRRLGPNVGAVKQRARLKNLLEAKANAEEKSQTEAKAKKEKKQEGAREKPEKKTNKKYKKNS